MTAFDIFVLVVAGIALISGFFAGIIKQLGTLAGFVAAIIACRLFGAEAAAWLAEMQGGQSAATTAIAYAGIFLLAFFAVKIVAHALGKLISALHLSVLDRLAGAAFRAAVWLFILSICFNVWAYAAPEQAPSGTLAEKVEQIAPAALGIAASKISELQNQMPDTSVRE